MLYGVSQLQNLPQKDFEFCSKIEVKVLSNILLKLKSHSCEGNKINNTCRICQKTTINWWANIELYKNKGFLIECDITYDDETKNRLAKFPPFPSHHLINFDELSPLNKQNCDDKPIGKQKRLIFSLLDLKDQVMSLHYAMLLAKLGVHIIVKSAIKFTESPFLSKWIKICSQERRNCSLQKDNLGVKLYKLMMNANYGKFLQDQIGLSDYKIISKSEDQLNMFRSDRLVTFSALNNNCLIVKLRKQKIVLDKPISLGIQILDHAKIILLSFYYGVLENTFGRVNLSPHYTDTDSIIVSIFGDSRDAIIKQILPVLDTSNYPRNHPFFTEKFARLPMYFKDETGGKQISFGAFVRTKSYCVVTNEELKSNNSQIEFIKNKGISNAIVSEIGPIAFIANILFNSNYSAVFCKLSSKNHQVYLTQNVKRCLTNQDLKVYILNCSIHILFYGHRGDDESGFCNICNM